MQIKPIPVDREYFESELRKARISILEYIRDMSIANPDGDISGLCDKLIHDQNQPNEVKE